ncbi:sortase [Candidatus Saccharibacteria bacterium]|nr:sortase [Candidatus Saccharibacteria bacterium]
MKQVISNLIYKNSGAFYAILLFGFFTLSFINTKFNYYLPAVQEIRDTASFAVNSPLKDHLEINDRLATISSSYSSNLPKTSQISTIDASAALLSARYTKISQSSGLFRIKNPVRVSDPSVDAGFGVKRYGDSFLYGHSSLAFAPLKTLSVGDRLEIEDGLKTATYRIEKRIVLSKSELDANSALRNAIYNASYRGKTYDFALMTCGNGSNDDPNYRLILFVSAT